LSKNYCAEVEYYLFFQLAMAGVQILTTTRKPKKHKSSVEAAMSSFRVTHFFKTAHSDESFS